MQIQHGASRKVGLSVNGSCIGLTVRATNLVLTQLVLCTDFITSSLSAGALLVDLNLNANLERIKT